MHLASGDFRELTLTPIGNLLCTINAIYLYKTLQEVRRKLCGCIVGISN